LQYSIAANAGAARVGTVTFTYNSGSTWPNTVNQDAAGSLRATVTSLSPISGTGFSTVATAQFSALGGYGQISSASISYNSTDSSSYCEAQFGQSSSGSTWVSLGDDLTPTWAYSSLPATGMLNVSRCSLDLPSVTVSGSGNNLTLTLPIQFASTFAGQKRVFLQADTSGSNGWSSSQQMGTWVVPSAQEPSITIQASAVGAPFSVDGALIYTAPVTFLWPAGSQHTISWLNTWTGQAGARYAFQNWTDGGSNPRTITVPSTSATYTANITAQYQLSLGVTPAGGGQLTAAPSSTDGYYNSGTSVQIQATPATGYGFGYFSGGASGANPVSVTMTGPLSVTGNFYCSPSASSYPPNPTSSAATTGLFDFSIGAGCAWTMASDSAWLTVSPASGTGNSTLQYTIAANPGAARTGTATLTYNGGAWTWPFTVNQDAAGSARASVTSFSPASGTGFSTIATAQFSESGGYGQIYYAIVTYNSADSSSYCQVEFGQNSSGAHWVFLGDDLTSTSAYSSLPATGTLSVSRCTLNLSSLMFSGSGTNLILTLPLQFATTFAGEKLVSLWAETSGSGGNSSSQQMGTWFVGPTPDAVFRDTYGSIRLTTYASSTLSNSGGLFASDPSAAQDPSGNTFVTARDNYNSIWANVYNPSASTWSGWQFGGGIIQGVPSIAVDTSGTGWVASRDTWNSYWLVGYTTSSGFGSWIPLEGIFSTDPVVTACGDGSIYLIGKDNWNSLWSGHYIPGTGSGTGFQGWQFGGGIITGQPSATCGGDNAVYVVAEDSWNSNWMVRVSGNTWGTWYFGGAITSVTPRIAALRNGSEAVVILDSTGVVYSTTYAEGTANGWQAWAEIGGILSDVAPAGVGGELYFAGKAPNGDLWWWQQAGNQWTWIGNNGIAAGALAVAPR
jgi:hypothetical protein